MLAAATAGLVVASVAPDATPAIALVPAWLTSAAHVPVYAAITALALATVAGDARARRRQTLVVLGLLGLGAAIELIQAGTGRSASGIDLVLNGVGIGLAVVLRRSWRRRAGAWRPESDRHDGNGEPIDGTGDPADGPCRSLR